jgi:protein MpaA
MELTIKRNRRRYGIIRVILIWSLLTFSCAPFVGRGIFNREGKRLYEHVDKSTLPWQAWAVSVEGRILYVLELGEGEKTTLILGAFHGDEILSGRLAYRFSEFLFKEMQYRLHCRVVLMPVVNPDGLVRGKRTNANGVDINRNFPTGNWEPNTASPHNFPGFQPGSEPETRAVMQLLVAYRPQRIVSIHTPLEVVNFDGPAADLAQRMSSWNDYPVQADIGYPTPGSFGTYAGIERNIPTITLELGEASFEKVWQKNWKSLWETLIY